MIKPKQRTKGEGVGGGAEGHKKGYVTIQSPRGGRRLVLVESLKCNLAP